MRIALISDMHGQLNFSIEKSDLLLIAGDILPASKNPYMSCIYQETFLSCEFYPWVEKQPVDNCVFIGGNHDWIFDSSFAIPKMPDKLHYLCDNEVTINGLRIYGTPQQPIFLNWAFNRTEEQLEKYFDNIPEGLDILLSHTAPYKIMDVVDIQNRKGNFGCKILRDKIKEKKPRFVVFGHFHGCYGIEKEEETIYVNCSIIDEKYKMKKKPIYIEV